ncbi:MAG: c-type cytochrome [Chloroflexi bacterium]|nr:c-type cytochrome [Chloroflexota bacterium]
MKPTPAPSNGRPAFVLAIFLALALSGCSLSLAQDILPPPGYTAPTYEDLPTVIEGAFPLSAPNAAAGKAIFAERCAPCHGATGLGDGPQAGQLPVQVPAIGTLDLAAQNSPAAWFAIVTLGNLDSFMPPFQNALSDRERWDVLAYVYSFSSQPSMIELGAGVYQAECAACHGENGQGDGPDSLGATDFTNQETMVALSDLDVLIATAQGIGTMPGYGDRLESIELEAVTAFVRAFTFPPYAEAALPLAEDVQPTPAIARPEVEAPPSGEQEAPQFSDEPLMGTFSGVVTNGSGGDLPAGLTVTLYGYDHTTEALTAETQTGPGGRFRFEDVELVPERLFFATVDFEDQTYGSDFVFADFGTEYELAVTVYETTSDASGLAVTRMHVFLEFPEPDKMQVVELIILTNNGDKAVVPASLGEPAVRYSLPEGAENLIFQEGTLGERFVATADGFGDTQAILPGTSDYQLLFAYTLPYTRKLEFVQPLAMDTQAVIVFVPDDSVKVSGEGLQDAGMQDIGGLAYQMFQGGGIPAGGALTLNVSGRHPLAGGGFTLSSNAASLALGLAGLALAGLAVFLWLRQARQEDEDDDETADDLLEAIVALDQDYEAGELDENAYEAERAELKARLAELLRETSAD